MASGQKQAGRTLFPFGQAPTENDDNYTAFSLLRAAPFVVRGPERSRVLTWYDSALITRIFSCSDADLPRTDGAFNEMISAAAQAVRSRALAQLDVDGTRYCIQYDIQCADGRTKTIEESAQRISGDGDMPTHISGVLRDVTHVQETRTEIEADIKFERVTGFLNKPYFEDILQYVAQAGSDTKLIRLSLTNLPDIIDAYGSAATDYLVKAIARRLQGELAPFDCASFDTQKEFKIFAPGASAEDLLARSKKLQYILGSIPIESPFGILKPEYKISLETIERRNPQNSKDDEINSRSSAPWFSGPKKIADVDILLALDQNRFALAFQPIKEAHSRKTAYYEALLRHQDETGKLVSAFPYISAAEKSGFIAAIDRRALSLARAALKTDDSLRLSINVSVGTIAEADDREAYLAEFAKLGGMASRVIVELTETMALGNIDVANLFSARLQAMGSKLAIDDFGAGHTSFNNLIGLEAEIIKIDGSYVRDIAASPQKQTFVRMIAEMAHVFGLKTVAEMIDNEADARMIERLGVDYLQGFHLGRPAPF